MIKSETKELYEQIDKLQEQIKEIRKKECLELKGMKAIVKYSHSLLWSNIENIFFDTFNHFLGLKENNSKSNWEVSILENDYFISNKTTNEKYTGQIVNYENNIQLKLDHKTSQEIIHTNKNICSVINSYQIKTLDIYVPLNSKIPTTLYMITFNPYILTYDSAIDMTNQIIRYYYNNTNH